MIEVYKGKDEKFYWRARAKNGKIVADGSQGYKSLYGLKKGLRVTKTIFNLTLLNSEITRRCVSG